MFTLFGLLRVRPRANSQPCDCRTELSVLELWEDSGPEEDAITVIVNGLGFGEREKQYNKYVSKKHFATGFHATSS